MELWYALRAVCRLEIFKKDFRGELFQTGSATGFFYRKAEKLYLVTNKHVVQSKRVYEDLLRVFPPKKGTFVELNLRDDNGNPLWKSYAFKDVDVAILEVPKGKTGGTIKIDKYGVSLQTLYCCDNKTCEVSAFSNDDLIPRESQYLLGSEIQLGGTCLVLGYPLDFYDKDHPFPIVRTGTIATIPWYDLRVKGKGRLPCFLIEARLHKGMSGSPVVSYPEKKEGAYYGNVKLLGIYSSEWAIEDEPLGLQNVWHARLIEEI